MISGEALQRHPFVDVSVSFRLLGSAASRAVSAGKRCKEIIEASILLNDQHDVLDRRVAGRPAGSTGVLVGSEAVPPQAPSARPAANATV